MLSRRRLCPAAMAAALIARQGPALGSTFDVRVAEFGVPVDIGDMKPGTWREFRIEGAPFIVGRLAPGAKAEWVVLSALCTHAECQVVPGIRPGGGMICFCHGSEYDTYGHVKRGPAPKNLDVPAHTISGGQLVFLAP